MAATRAYVLVETAVGQGPSVAEALRAIPGLVSVDRVTGPYDIIVIFEAEDLGAVGDLVTEHVHSMPGVIRTVTCLAMS